MKDIYNTDDTFLARWLNDELSDVELTEFKKSEAYKDFEKIAKNSQRFEVPNFNKEKVFKNIEEKINQPKVVKLMPKWVYAVAASILLFIGSTFFINNSISYKTEIGKSLAVTLPDGSLVELNGNSELTYVAANWEEGNRILDLKGEGFFKVKKGSKFSVHTPEGKIVVLGTQFNVLTLKKYFEVKCFEGKVKVSHKNFKNILIPGTGVSFTKSKVKNLSFENIEPNWLNNKYEFKNTPLSVVFKDLGNLYKVSIELNDVDLNEKYTGKLITNNLNKALKAICIPMNIKFRIENDIVKLHK